EQTLMSMTYAVIVDCPGSNAIIENIGSSNSYVSGQTVPQPTANPIGTFGTVGGAQNTTTTSTTTTVYTNVAETATWTDHLGNSHTVTVPAGEYHSSISQAYANNLATDAANQEANRLTIEDAEPVQTQVGP